MPLEALLLSQAQSYVLILARVGTLMIAAPILGHARIPPQVRAGLALVISLLLLMSLGPKPLEASQGLLQTGSAVLGELFVGLAIAYTSYLFFTAVQMAGQMIDIQAGFGLVNVLDPASNAQVSILGQFYYLVALTYFLGLDGHHMLLRALGQSFEAVPLGSLGWFEKAGAAGPKLAEFFTRLFSIALQVAAPAVAALFLTNLTMGLLSRTIPQMNVFIVGLPLNVLVGLLVTLLSLRFLGSLLRAVVDNMGRGIAGLLNALGG